MSDTRSFSQTKALTLSQAVLKRCFDILVSLTTLLALWWLILLLWIVTSIDNRGNGFFTQRRVGYQGNIFNVVKFRTMRTSDLIKTTVTTLNDPRITFIGSWLRKTKLDELPQLWNVLIGDMSLVGPRPDVPGFADRLTEDEKLILTVRPGITGPATLKYRDEEKLLAKQENPEAYNREILFPDKVKINLHYVRNWSFLIDLKYLWLTLFK